MAGHSHWAGIKHKKGRVDKLRSKIFSKISKEITVSAKLGSQDPESNPRLRSAIQAAKSANMPKDNIERAINKSILNQKENYENLRYEGFGPLNVVTIVETLTDNKNRTASNIRTIFQKFGGKLGEVGVASHQFKQTGVMRLEKKLISEEKILELTINAGAEDCISDDNYHTILTKMQNFYKVKSKIEKEVNSFVDSGIEWHALNRINLDKEDQKLAISFIEALENDDDVQNVFTNLIIE